MFRCVLRALKKTPNKYTHTHTHYVGSSDTIYHLHLRDKFYGENSHARVTKISMQYILFLETENAIKRLHRIT